MPGITVRQIKPNDGLRSWQHFLAVPNGAGGAALDAYFASVADPSTLVASQVVTPLKARMAGSPRSLTVELTTDGTVQTRLLTFLVRGEDLFGNSKTETITVTGGASATIEVYGENVWSRIDAFEILVASLLVAGDNLKVGCGVMSSPEKVTYGIPYTLDGLDDIHYLSVINVPGASNNIVDGTLANLTWVPDHNGVKIAAAAAPVVGNTLLVMLGGFTKWKR
jgi:hypothetical protein